jgi:hypothetical protein
MHTRDLLPLKLLQPHPGERERRREGERERGREGERERERDMREANKINTTLTLPPN